MNIHPTYNSYVSSVRKMLLRRQNLSANAGDTRDASSIPGLGRSPGGGHGDPLQNSCLENAMGRGAWRGQSTGLQRVRYD